MDELEAQLRRLADARADRVGPVDAGALSSRAGLRRWMAVAAAAVVVVAGAWLFAGRGGEPGPLVVADSDDAVSVTTTVLTPSDAAPVGEVDSAFVLVGPVDQAGFPWLAGSPFPAGSPLTPWSFGSAASVNGSFAIWDAWEDLSPEFGIESGPGTWPRYGRPHLMVATPDGGSVADWPGEFAGVQAADGRLASSRLVDSTLTDLQEGDWSSDVVVRATVDAEPDVWVEAGGRRVFAWGWAEQTLVTVAAGEDGVTTALLAGPGNAVTEFEDATPVALAPEGNWLALSVQSTTGVNAGLESVVVVDTATGEVVGEPFAVEVGLSGRGTWSEQALIVATRTGAIVLSADSAGSLEQTAGFDAEIPARHYVIAATGNAEAVEVLVEGTEGAATDERGWFRSVKRCDAVGCFESSSVTAEPGEYILVLSPEVEHRPLGTRRVDSALFPVSVVVPEHWSADLSEGRDEWFGDDGFVQIMGVSAADGDLDKAATQATDHPLRPFGTEPTIEVVEAGGRDARLITPSSDSAPTLGANGEGLRFGQLLVPASGNGESDFEFMAVVADLDHLHAVVASLRWDASAEAAQAPADMCVSVEPFGGGEPQHGTFLFGDAWPVLDDDLILNNGFGVTAFNDGEVRGVLLAGEFYGLSGPAVFVDGAGGLVVQGRFAITHVRADQTVVELVAQDDDDPWAFPGYELHGTAEIDGEWYAYATHAPANAYEVGEGDLVLLPLDGGPERVVTRVVQEEGGATAHFDPANRAFVLDWGSLGDRWITAVTPTGEPVELPWNQWADPSEATETVVLGVSGWQTYRAIHESSGTLTVEGFNSATGDTVYPSTALPTGPETLITRLLPLEDRLVISASTPNGPCTRIFGPDNSFIDVPVRGHASPPLGFYGTGD